MRALGPVTSGAPARGMRLLGPVAPQATREEPGSEVPSEMGGSSADWSAGGADNKPDPSGAVESVVRGAGQGVTLGFGDELAAAAGAAIGNSSQPTFIGRYREIRDSLRRDNDAAKKSHPIAFGLGEVAGGMPLAIAAPGAKPNAGRLIASGAGLAGATGAGESTAEDAEGVAKDAGKAAAVGGALTGGVLGLGKLAPLAADGLDQLAVSTGRRILRNAGGTINARVPLTDDAVREVADSGVFKMFGTSKGAADRVEALRESVGDQYGKILTHLESQGFTGPEAEALAQKYAAEGRSAAASNTNPAVRGVYDTEARALRAQEPGTSATVAPDFSIPRDSQGRLGLTQTEDMKRSLQDRARSAYKQMQPSEVGDAHEQAASMMRQATEDEIAQQAAASTDPATKAIAAQFEPVKGRLSRIIAASNLAREGVARSANRHAFSLYDIMAGSGAMAHGGPIEGGAAALGMHMLRTRGPSTLEEAARLGSNGIDFLTSPASTPAQQRAQALIDALRRTALPAASEEAGLRTSE